MMNNNAGIIQQKLGAYISIRWNGLLAISDFDNMPQTSPSNHHPTLRRREKDSIVGLKVVAKGMTGEVRGKQCHCVIPM